MNQMMHALDLPDRAVERGQVSGPAHEQSLYDTKRAFDVTIDNLAKICVGVDMNKLAGAGIYTRETFEQKYGLTWAAEEVRAV